jgi:hypothetical protein
MAAWGVRNGVLDVRKGSSVALISGQRFPKPRAQVCRGHHPEGCTYSDPAPDQGFPSGPFGWSGTRRPFP